MKDYSTGQGCCIVCLLLYYSSIRQNIYMGIIVFDRAAVYGAASGLYLNAVGLRREAGRADFKQCFRAWRLSRPLLVFPIAEIGPHTGHGEVLPAAIQRRNAVVLTRDKPPVLVQDGPAGELVMLEGEVLLRRAVVGIFRAYMFQCCQWLHLPPEAPGT